MQRRARLRLGRMTRGRTAPTPAVTGCRCAGCGAPAKGTASTVAGQDTDAVVAGQSVACSGWQGWCTRDNKQAGRQVRACPWWAPPVPPWSCAALAWACSQVWTRQAAPWPAGWRQRTCRGSAGVLSTPHHAACTDCPSVIPERLAHVAVLHTQQSACVCAKKCVVAREAQQQRRPT